MKKIVIIALAALWLGACTTTQTTVGQLVTGTLPNPITSANIYELKNVYAIAAQTAVNYRGYCYARSYAVLMADPVAKSLCQNRRATVRSIQKYKNTAFSAVTTADQFVKNNPTLGVGDVVNSAWAAVTAFQNATPKVPQ